MIMTTERNLPPVLPQNANVAEENELEFEQLLDGGKIDDALALMDTRGAECMDVFTREYLVENHEINSREPKITQRRDGTIKGVTERARLPVPYQVYINEVAVVFLFGQPVQWQQQSDGTDEAFEKFLEVMKDARFDAKIRQCKRLAGAETECALLFRTYKDEDDKSPRLQLRILAASKHDEIYTRFDEYENLVAFAWGYHVKTKGNQTQRRVNVYTKADVYECAKGEDGGWQVTRTPNKAGKIPVILFRQEKEWAGVERLIKREEAIASGTADANDYFADPIMIMAADVAQSLPDKDEKAKTLLTSDTEGGVNNAAKYLTWDNAPQSKQQEITWLQEQILSKSFTPDIKLDTLKSLGNLSGKALRTVMLLADIKASKRKEVYDEMLDRTASLVTTLIGRIIDVSLEKECESLRLQHVWQEPFGDDVAGTLDNITKAVDGGILSNESAIELNPLVRDVPTEQRRLEEEKEERSKTQASLFGGGAGTSFAPNRNAKKEEGEEGEEKPKEDEEEGK